VRTPPIKIKREWMRTKTKRGLPIYYVAKQQGVGGPVTATIYIHPVLRSPKLADLRRSLVKHEMDEIKAWARGYKDPDGYAHRREPQYLKRIKTVQQFWRVVAERTKKASKKATTRRRGR